MEGRRDAKRKRISWHLGAEVVHASFKTSFPCVELKVTLEGGQCEKAVMSNSSWQPTIRSAVGN